MRIRRWLILPRRLTLAVLLGVLVFTGLEISSLSVEPSTSILIAWNTTMWVYLLSLWRFMSNTPPEDIGHIARQHDESTTKILILIGLASIMSFFAIFFELAAIKHVSGVLRTSHLIFSGVTLLGAWLILPTMLAVHYAHLFYRDTTSKTPETPTLRFPDALKNPLYLDFLYFSFTIAVASQTADVAVGDSKTRGVVLAQSIISFFFNMTILGLTINIGASLLP